MQVVTETKPGVVALVGNPNTGKSTLFNRLTGTRQKVANYPGVTVERKSGTVRLGDRAVEAVDLPGAYSLAACSPDDLIAVEALTGSLRGETAPDVVVCVVDATNLQRNLFMVSQVADLGLPMVVAMNLHDDAEKQGLRIDVRLLEKRLGVPCIPTVASRGEGIDALKRVIRESLTDGKRMTPMKWPEPVQSELGRLQAAAEADIGRSISPTEAQRILFDCDPIVADGLGWEREKSEHEISRARQALRDAHFHPLACETMLRYDHLEKLLDGVVRKEKPKEASATESIDKLLTHRVWGLLLFGSLMYVVFQAVYSWAGPFMDGIEAGKVWLQEMVSPLFAGTPVLQSLVAAGMIEGVGSVLIFLPQILILFGFIALIEDTGYMARAAFLMDKLLHWCGLNGRSFVPLLSSYACAVPGIMAARTIVDPKARTATILVAPLMSCSARLPVYVLLIGAFVEPSYGPGVAGLTLFAMHFVGMVVAMPVAFLLNRFVLKTRPQPFLLELPPYRVPRMRDVIWRMFEKGKDFVVNAGTVIFAMTIIIWAMLYFPRPESVRTDVTASFVQRTVETKGIAETEIMAALKEADSKLAVQLENRIESAYIEQSVMGRLGKTVQPVFALAGFDWKITVGVLASFPAREVIIATLGIIYNLGGDADEESESLRESLAAERWTEGPLTGRPVYTLPVVFAIMVFFALCMQCGATIAVIGREVNWKYAVFTFFYMTFLAWLGAVLVYQAGSALSGV